MTKYTFDGYSVNAKLAGINLSELEDVRCRRHCQWNKNNRTVSGLRDCTSYNIVAIFPGCKKSEYIAKVPPGKTKLLIDGIKIRIVRFLKHQFYDLL